MALPTYQAVHNYPPKQDAKNPSGNCGLWFERFYDRYKYDFSETKESDASFSDWLKDFDHVSGYSELLDSVIQRQSHLVNSLGGASAIFKTDWHFVTGMGNPHPLENGFNWHPVLGVPYLSGSSIKGLVRSWVESWQFEDGPIQEKAKRLLDWFGSVSKNSVTEPETGKVMFFDAIPFKPVRLSSDIMTPHMGKWYADGGKFEELGSADKPDVIPGDWHSPKPIHFLAAKEPVFLFSFAVRNELFADEVDLDEVMQCLTDALEWLGVGAKTAVGYGQFYRDEKATQSLQKELDERLEALAVSVEKNAQLKGLSGIALELTQYVQEAGWRENKDAFTKPNDVEGWLEKLEADVNEQAILLMCELVDIHFPGLFTNPDKTSGKKKKPAFNQRQKDIAGRLLALKASVE